MSSMTGYGKAEYCENGLTLIVEMKTVNNRTLDLNTKVPRSFIAYEDLIRKTVSEYVKRGRVDLFITFIDNREKESQLDVDFEKAESYYKASNQIAEKLGLNNDITVSSIMRLPDVVTDNTLTDVSDIESILKETLINCLNKLNEMRKIEGEKLVCDMLKRIETIKDLRQKIVLRAPLVVSDYKAKLKERILEALNGVELDEARLLNEVAFYTDKVNIDEELTRLNSHINQFTEIVKQEGSGKKLDFLMQEFNRETNTICSKSNDIEVTNYALSLKNEIEKIREQVQNLE